MATCSLSERQLGNECDWIIMLTNIFILYKVSIYVKMQHGTWNDSNIQLRYSV